MPNKTSDPATPTSDDKIKPGFDLSTRYHNTGFARASVNETWSVDCQGSFLYNGVSTSFEGATHKLTIANAMPTKAPTLRTTGFQSAPRPLLNRPEGRSSSLPSDAEEEALR